MASRPDPQQVVRVWRIIDNLGRRPPRQIVISLWRRRKALKPLLVLASLAVGCDPAADPIADMLGVWFDL